MFIHLYYGTTKTKPPENSIGNIKLSIHFSEACQAQAVEVANPYFFSDKSLSASSSRSDNKPYKARLKSSSGAWSPSNDENADDYLEINLGDVYFICAVATQGHPSEDAWTKSYELYLFLEYWIRYKENNTQKV